MPILIRKETLTVSKLAAATRQLDEAIRLFFDRRDPISIHTLTAAALEVLSALGKRRQLISLFNNNPFIRKDKVRWFRAFVRHSQNFFKHADKDPDGLCEFNPKETHFLLFDAVLLANHLEDMVNRLRARYLMWFMKMYPDVVVRDALPPELRDALERHLEGVTTTIGPE